MFLAIINKYIYNNMPFQFSGTDLCIIWLDWWVFTKVWVCVLIVHVVTNADKFLATVRAGDQHNSHTNSIALRNQSSVRSISLFNKAIF